MTIKSCKTAAAAKRQARKLFGDDWEQKYTITGSDEAGYDIVLHVPGAPAPVADATAVHVIDPDRREAEAGDEAPEAPEAEGEAEAEAEAEAEGEGEAEEASAAAAFKGDRLKARKADYVKHKHCGDELATAVAGVETGVLLGAAEGLGVGVAKWAHLNNGQRRMNCGNVLRTMIKKADETRRAEILEVLRALPRKVEVRVLRNGRPVKRCETLAEAEAFIAESLAKVKEGEQAPTFKTEDVVVA